jgi:hypothetical protein
MRREAGPNYQIFQINEIGEVKILTGKHEGMKKGGRQGRFLDRINMIKRIGRKEGICL